MGKLWIITKTEFCRYFMSPLAYIYLIFFLLLNGSFTFYFGHFFDRGQADLLPMFVYLPWLYLLFIPAISMRLWAEEFRSRTIVQLVSLPVSVASMVWGKFLASWFFCLLALVLTMPFWLSLNIIAHPDNAMILSGYIGAFLLAGSMLAISQAMSSLSKSQVVALVLSVPANLFFFLSGLEFVLGNLRHILSPSLIDLIASFSFLTHFEAMYQGLLEARDIIFFSSIVVLFNILTILIINYKTYGTTWFKSISKKYYTLLFVFFMMAFCGINLLSNTYLRYFQIDFTADKIYTPDDSTINILKNIKNEITARLYYSQVLGEKNPNVRELFDRIRILLKQYAKISDGKIRFKIYDPLPLSNSEDRAITSGIQPLPVIDRNINAYFGLVFSNEEDKQIVIPFFPESRSTMLEQDLAEAIYKLEHKKPILGIISSLPLADSVIENVATQEWEIFKILREYYDLKIINETDRKLPKLDVLMIAHPRKLNEELKKNIIDYSLSGGKILAFFDVATEAKQIFAPTTEEFKPSDFGIITSAWGIKFIDNAVVADMGKPSFIDATTDYKNNPNFTQDLIQFYIDEDGFSKQSSVIGKIQKIMTTSASVFVPTQNQDIHFEPLLSASSNSSLLSSKAVYNRISPEVILRNFKPDNYPKVIAAHIKGRSSPLDVIVVGDSDLLYDNFWTTHIQVLNNHYSIPAMDNANFVLNALDVLRGDLSLVNLRGKKYKNRQIKTITDLRKSALAKFKIQENEIFDNINKAKIGMQEIIAKRHFEKRINFTSEELAVIAKIRKQINDNRKELYNIRNNLNTDIYRLETTLKWFNIYFVPIIILIIFIAPILFSAFKHRTKQYKFGVNKQLIVSGIIAILIFTLGILASGHDVSFANVDAEDEPLFVDLANKVNLIDKISIKNAKHELMFYKDTSGEWKLKGYEHFLVYQNRIRNFINILLDAKYYEKKSSNIDNLTNFGLSPIDDPNSKATQIELLTYSDKKLVSFNVGNYDIDLGRGAKGAYVRFNNSFQVWLAQIDLVDLNLNPQNWTYSTLWNLQWGRLVEVNKVKNVDTLANIAKELLNTHLNEISSAPDNLDPTFSLHIVSEGNNKISIIFYQVGNDYWAEYKFEDITKSDLLQNFSNYANGIFYKISPQSIEGIKNAIKALKNVK
ncbi:MAG: DUF4340 domain-containing protein [Alphaproteobacteria bacterium]|nr:DUF4340 domain-containing protein [Alphaproteobacteria bacterium]